MKREHLHIESPCQADWDTMTAAGRKRFCDSCKKHVHDLSAMTEREAQAVLAAPRTDGLCVRYIQDAVGNVVFRMVDTSLVPLSRLARAKHALRATAAGVATVAAAAGSTACMGAMQPPPAAPIANSSAEHASAEPATSGRYAPPPGNRVSNGTQPAPLPEGHSVTMGDIQEEPTAPSTQPPQMRVEMGEAPPYVAPPTTAKPQPKPLTKPKSKR